MNSQLRVWMVVMLGLGTSLHAQTFVKTIGSAGRNERGFSLHRTAAGVLLLGGSVADSAMVQRIDDDGNVLWSRSFRPPGTLPKQITYLTEGPDGSIIGCGNGIDANNALKEGFHFRMDVDGNMFWVRYWENLDISERRIVALSAGEYLVFANVSDSDPATDNDILPTRIDAASGDILWLSDRLDLFSAIPFTDEVHAATTIGSGHYAASRMYVTGAPLSGIRAGLSKFSYDGQHLWTKYLLFSDIESRRIYPTDIIATADSLTLSYSGDINGASTVWSQGLVRMDTLGNIAWAKDFNIGGSGVDFSSRIIPTSFGYVIAGSTPQTATPRLFLMGVSFGGTILWTKGYGDPGQVQVLSPLYASNAVSVGNGYLMTGHVVQPSGDEDILLIRTDGNGNVECSDVIDLNALTTILPEDIYDSPIQNIPFSVALGTDQTAIVDAAIVDLCAIEFSLGNDTTLCGTLLLDAQIANAIYEWQDGSTAQTLEATTSGTYWVRVTVDCCVASDTIEVGLGQLPELDLGGDTTMCAGDLLIITAPSGTWTTLWSDGTDASDLFVFDGGTYWVVFTDGACTATDTIEVEAITIPTVDLGPDTASCDGSAIVLEPTTTFTDSYVWSDGSDQPTLEVQLGGEYAVRVGNICGYGYDTVQVAIVEPISFDLGADTLICEGTTIPLSIAVPGWELIWSDGTTGGVYTITEGGTYWLDALNSGCAFTDTIVLYQLVTPVVLLGNDTVLCNGGTLLLTPTLLNVDALLWSDGSTNEELLVDTTGTYSLAATNVCGTGTDAVLITVVPPLAIGLGADTVLCGTAELLLDGSASGADLVWMDTLVSPSYIVFEAGMYWVQGTVSGCTAADTIEVGYSRLALLELGSDTVLCTISTVGLDAGGEGVDAVWQDNTVGRDYLAYRTGLYVAAITNYCGTITDSIRLSFAVPETVFEDIDLCPGEKVELNPQGEMVQTIWTTGDTARTITVGEGAYAYSAIDIYGCEHVDQVFVRITEGLDGTVYVPNSFTPNADGVNESFGPVGAEDGLYELILYDRWGREMYKSMDPLMGWDGTAGGSVVSPGVYTYTLTYEDRCNANNTVVITRGHVTLIR